MGAWWSRAAIALLATWRISAWLWYEHGAEGTRAFISRWPWAGRQIDCFWCASFWVALVVTVIEMFLPWWLLVPFALSGAAILLSGGGRVIWREMVDNGES